MGKSSNKSKPSSAKNEAAKKCTCDHPFQCSCGNRPERPSKGHKWDPATQQWGGKGHKQKGASVQAAVVGQAEKVTTVGNVAIKQWQKLPSDILKDLCRKNGKGLPIYKRAEKTKDKGAGGHRFTLVVPDTNKKGSTGDHDVELTPSLSVPNEEQAKEEAALLGLLYIFPKLPHERTLPEPYRSTFLGALKISQCASQADNSNNSTAPKKESKKNKIDMKTGSDERGNCDLGTKLEGASNSGAKANTQLTANLSKVQKTYSDDINSQSSSTHVVPLLTKAQIKEARKQHQREVQARIRKHEAIRNANKPMEVFMCASLRRRIERMLSGNSNGFDSTEGDEEDSLGDGPMEEEEEGVIQSYVTQRLVHEGFTPSQVRKAYRSVFSEDINVVGSDNHDEQMDKAYEETLQYLCIHLNEDQLPIGFDPRGGTLDVVLPALKSSHVASGVSRVKKSDISAAGSEIDINYDSTIIQFAHRFGLTPKEAYFILSLEQSDEAKPISSMFGSIELMQKWKYWSVLCRSASLPLGRCCFSDKDTLSAESRELNREAASNELQALEAIFDRRDFSASKLNDDAISVSIRMPPFCGFPNLFLEVIYCDGVYPDLLPMTFLTYKDKGNEEIRSDYQNLLQVDTKIIKFLSTLEPGQEVIFELFGRVQELLQDTEAISSSSHDASNVLSLLNRGGKQEASKAKNVTPPNENGDRNTVELNRLQPRPQPVKRPREKSTFWITPPKDTPPAVSFPRLSAHLEKARKSLPAAKARAGFLSLMENASKGGRVVLVTGETGCGKTTQIPQYILENSPIDAKIVVAQPRRLAATGVASRVAIERGESMGYGSVGYSVRGDSNTCPATRLLFCTTGILLRQLQSQCSLDNITHIIIDEVHERHLDSDVLLAILKRILPSTPHLNVVLMSATMDADRFANYWGPQTPRMHIPGFTHPVKDFMLEDVLQLTGYIPPRKGTRRKGDQGKSLYQIQPSFVDGDTLGADCDDETFNAPVTDQSLRTSATPLSTEERINRMDVNDIDYDLIAVLIGSLLRTKEDDGSILVFLPGAGEIDRAERAINQVVNSQHIHVLPLHGGLQPEKQQEVFLPSNGKTKIILSTNVAETSITIPDCTVVIDTCKEKQSSFDPINRMPLLLERFASQDSLRQRRGRAGRVRPGVCYKLISDQHYNSLAEHGEPEIKRCALDQTILSLLFLGLEDGTGGFLSSMIDSPSQESIDSALTCLEKIGAIVWSGGVATLSPLGSHLAGIPAPPTVAKLLVMGCLLGCRKIALAIAAGMSVGRSPFINMTSRLGQGRSNNDGGDDIKTQKYDKHEQILEARSALLQTTGSSDHLMLGKSYLLWENAKGAERIKFCGRLGLVPNIMKEMHQLVQQLNYTLNSLGFMENEECNTHSYSWRVVRAVVVSALAPAQIVRVQRPTTKYTETVEGAIRKEGKAKDLKFFIRGGEGCVQSDEERVFIHPSCNMFSISDFSCPWLVYHRMVRTWKAFIHDATEATAYALLLFGGKMDVQASKGLIVLDGRIELSANARIGSLIGGLRKKIDRLLEEKVADPSLDISSTAEMKLVADLLRYDGLGK